MKKFTLFFSVFLLMFSFFFVSFSYASNNELPEFPKDSYTNIEYIVVEDNGATILYLFGCNSSSFDKGRFYVSGTNTITFKFPSTSNEYRIERYSLNESTWEYSSAEGHVAPYSFGYNGDILYSSIDIYASASGDDIFFQKTPVTEPTTKLAPILETVEMSQPITTTIVGLAKLLIPLLICLIAFWKAWRLLSKILHKS